MPSLRSCLILACGVPVILAGCAAPRMAAPVEQPTERITAAPTRPVDRTVLEPVEGLGQQRAQPSGMDMAAVPRSGGQVTEGQLTGGWQVASGGGSCQMTLSMTSWTGGYRGSTRGCSGDMARVNAWSYDGGQLILKDDAGGVVARLSAQSSSAMSGATVGGQSVSASRG